MIAPNILSKNEPPCAGAVAGAGADGTPGATGATTVVSGSAMARRRLGIWRVSDSKLGRGNGIGMSAISWRTRGGVGGSGGVMATSGVSDESGVSTSATCCWATCGCAGARAGAASAWSTGTVRLGSKAERSAATRPKEADLAPETKSGSRSAA